MSLLRSTLVVGLATALSRILGFVRDVLIAATLGAGPVADAFLVAFRLPNLARRILGEGGLNAGFVPLHARLRAEAGPETAAHFAGQALTGLALLVLVLVAVVEIAAGVVALVLAPGYADDPAGLALAAHLLRLAFPFVAGATLASLVAALLNAERRFTAVALAPVAVNLVLIAVLLALQGRGWPPERLAAVLAVGVSLSGLVQLGIVVGAVRRARIPLSLAWPRLTPPIRRLIAIGGPALAASGAAQLIILAATAVASFSTSAISWLYYADRVFQLPLGFVGVAVGLVLLPEIAARDAAGDRAGVVEAQNRALEAGLGLSLPAATALFLLAFPICAVLFQRGAFTAQDTTGTALALAGLSFGLPFAVMGKVFSQALFARGLIRAAVLAGGFGILVTVAAGFLLSDRLGVLGIGLAITLGLAAHALSLAAILKGEGLWGADPRLRRRLPRIGLACLAMAGGLIGLKVAVQATFGSLDPGPLDVLLLAIFCGAGLALYAGAAWVLGAVTRDDLRMLRGKT